MDSRKHSDSIVIDHSAREVFIDKRPIQLTRAEFTLLRALANHPRRAFSREYLTQIVTDSQWVDETHALDTLVFRLRRKLGESGSRPRRIVTVHGYGYRFEPEHSPSLGASFAANAQPPDFNPENLSAFLLADADHTIEWTSDAFGRLFGWKPTEIQGKAFDELVHPDDKLQVMAVDAELHAGHPAAMVIRLRTCSGEDRLVELLARPIVVGDGTPVACLGELRLVTGDMKAQAPALESIRISSATARSLA